MPYRHLDVDDPAAEDVDQLLDLAPLAAFRFDLDEHQVALDKLLLGVVEDANDRDDLLKLLPDLVQHVIVAADDERHSRKLRVLGFTDRKAVDVEGARGEHPGNLSQHTGLVDDQG